MPELQQLLAADDHFALLGMDRRFDLNGEVLQANYEENLRVIETADAPTNAVLSARLADAYATLADPERRAEYLLELLGGPNRETVPYVPGLIRVALDELAQRATAVGAGEAESIAAIQGEAQTMRIASLARLGALFRSLSGGDNPVVLRQRKFDARAELNALARLREIAAAGT